MQSPGCRSSSLAASRTTARKSCWHFPFNLTHATQHVMLCIQLQSDGSDVSITVVQAPQQTACSGSEVAEVVMHSGWLCTNRMKQLYATSDRVLPSAACCTEGCSCCNVYSRQQHCNSRTTRLSKLARQLIQHDNDRHYICLTSIILFADCMLFTQTSEQLWISTLKGALQVRAQSALRSACSPRSACPGSPRRRRCPG